VIGCHRVAVAEKDKKQLIENVKMFFNFKEKGGLNSAFFSLDLLLSSLCRK
jgi:hypothetical protein